MDVTQQEIKRHIAPTFSAKFPDEEDSPDSPSLDKEGVRGWLGGV
jgi:hypothetical protein